MEQYIFKILHNPTGLFYCSRKGRWKDEITNLSNKGNFYEDIKTVEKVLKEDVDRAYINKAQAERCNLQVIPSRWCWSEAKKEDFTIKKYTLKEIE